MEYLFRSRWGSSGRDGGHPSGRRTHVAEGTRGGETEDESKRDKQIEKRRKRGREKMMTSAGWRPIHLGRLLWDIRKTSHSFSLYT